MERFLKYQSTEDVAKQLELVREEQERIRQEADAKSQLGSYIDLLSVHPTEPTTHEEAERPATPRATQQPQRREVPAQPQAYPDEGWRERPRDFTPLRNAGIGLTLLLTAGLVGMQIALNRLNSDSPSSEPKPKPTPTFTPGEVTSLKIYNELIQAQKTHPYGYAEAFDVIVDGSNIRNRSRMNGYTRGRLDSGTHIIGPNITVLGDNPSTEKIEDENDKDAEIWLAFPCSTVTGELKFPTDIPSSLPEDKEICFTHGENVRQVK